MTDPQQPKPAIGQPAPKQSQPATATHCPAMGQNAHGLIAIVSKITLFSHAGDLPKTQRSHPKKANLRTHSKPEPKPKETEIKPIVSQLVVNKGSKAPSP
jgi:hypothetical protein